MGGGAKYFGERNGSGCSVFAKHDFRWVPLRLQTNKAEYSPADFDWGYMCRGAAQLALAILVDHLKNRVRALALYEDFEFMVVARLNRNEWLLSEEEIDGAISEIECRPKAVA
jgi:hypothetical protein